jgi:hypothetical protein
MFMCYRDLARAGGLTWIVYSCQARDIWLSRLVQKGFAANWRSPPDFPPMINLHGMKSATYLYRVTDGSRTV